MNLCGILKQTFAYACDANYISVSPYRVKVNKKKIIRDQKNKLDRSAEIFLPEEQQILTDELKKIWERDPSYLSPMIILLDFQLGTRIGEILAIKYGDIYDGMLHIQRQLVSDADVEDLNNIKRKDEICQGSFLQKNTIFTNKDVNAKTPSLISFSRYRSSCLYYYSKNTNRI